MMSQVPKKSNRVLKNAGFTVLESIVAILVLSLTVSGVFTAVQQSLSQSILVRDEVRAFYLAQEAFELIRNRRDSNQLDRVINGSTNSWLTGMTALATDPCYFGRVCQVDASSASFTYCNSTEWNSCVVLNQNPTDFRYGYNGGWTTVTNFKREIKFESVSATEVAVVIRISWTKGVRTREFKVKTYLHNWI